MHQKTSSNFFTLTTFVSCVLLSVSSTPICDKVCVCNEELTNVDCSRIKSNILPPVDMWPENVTDLDLNYNFITAIDVQITHSKLSTLKLSNNLIRNISLSVFGGLSNLKFLDLSFNEIEEIELETFYGLEKLLVLNISQNNIKTLPQNAFYNLLDLEILVLSDNPFRFLEKVHFKENINLKRLEIAKIDAYSLPFDVFSTVGQLEYLDLSDNSFHEIPTDALRSARSLKILQLDINPIEELNQKSFRKLSSLEVLKIRRMPNLKTVGPETFSDLFNLKVLEIKFNKQLAYIDGQAFLGLFNDSSKLEVLDFELNQLSSLSEVPCKSMKKLNLQRNPWNCNCYLKWLRKCYIPELYAADLRCQEPYNVRNKLLVLVAENDFICDLHNADVQELIHHNRVLRTVSLAFTCVVMITLGALVIFVVKFKSIRTWYKNKRRGPGAVYYVRAKSYPADR